MRRIASLLQKYASRPEGPVVPCVWRAGRGVWEVDGVIKVKNVTFVYVGDEAQGGLGCCRKILVWRRNDPIFVQKESPWECTV